MRPVESRVAVVGAGVVGLTTAIRLRESGRDVTLFAESRSPNITSDRAGAVFSPFRVNAHPDMMAWTKTSYGVFAEMATQVGPACGISMGMMHEFFFEPLAGDPWWSTLVEGYARADRPPAPYAAEVSGIVPKMNMSRFMPWLEQRFERELGGAFVARRVDRLEALFDEGFETVVNCAGLGARELAGDTTMTPYRGQILRVRDVLGIDDFYVEDGRGAITTYVFPFDDYMVLGGTFERGETKMETRAADLESIVKRCQAMLAACGIANVERLAEEPLVELAGLRPCRVRGESLEAVRLELESHESRKKLVHNYGHGRAGVTLAWGCAEAVVQLVNFR